MQTSTIKTSLLKLNKSGGNIKLKMFFKWNLKLFLFIICWPPYDSQLTDSECLIGSCKLDTECPSLIKALEVNNTHGLQTCGFQRENEFVCCPDFPKNIETSTEITQNNKNSVAPIFADNRRKREMDFECLVGSCKLDAECPSLIKALEFNNTHSLQHCGFKGENEIVCCPDFPKIIQDSKNSLVPISANKRRKSDLACQQYVKTKTSGVGDRILGGKDAVLGEFPHMVLIGYRSSKDPNLISWSCAGSLITEKFVLTAAHCNERSDAVPAKIKVGFINLNDTTFQMVDIDSFISHESYLPSNRTHDVAVIKLKNSVRLGTNAYPACLYQRDNVPLPLHIAGWGYTNAYGSESDTLQKATLDVRVIISECSRLFRNHHIEISTSQICAGSRQDNKADTCQGDSGGPLQIILNDKQMHIIVGVTSFGETCGGPKPGVYTKVYSYLNWIENIVWPNPQQ